MLICQHNSSLLVMLQQMDFNGVAVCNLVSISSDRPIEQFNSEGLCEHARKCQLSCKGGLLEASKLKDRSLVVQHSKLSALTHSMFAGNISALQIRHEQTLALSKAAPRYGCCIIVFNQFLRCAVLFSSLLCCTSCFLGTFKGNCCIVL
jgi:hypothetical protein